ncbi:uncharacterized protein LOC124457373 [Xenia sp. Carnegie-2017]|uniref:uncharacterized protein LOC124457373 n=1 Tax=Xenia sp. Carnegie-2017 TaxID=2897299 RepID=UPI001F036D75|nr:uncharacterized protein LOC124457373 [Xenia sp. Carnegie-2017]
MVNHSLPLLRGGGVVAIGQKLECENGVFNPNMSFVGEISYLNLWNHDVACENSSPMVLINDKCTTGLNRSTVVIRWNHVYQFTSENVVKVPSLHFLSCKEAMKYGSSKDGVYLIKTDTSLGYSRVFCMKNILGCSGEGWTLVMKIDGEKETFDFESTFWTNKKSYKKENGKTGMDNLETKLPTYWSTKLNKICVGMKFNGKTNFISFNFQAKSLYDIIAKGKYHQTNVSRKKWMSLIKESVLQQNCNKEGFNAKAGREKFARVRVGILGNNQNHCMSSNSFIGFGCMYKKCNQNAEINSCGNFKRCKGNNDKQSMGYIFVS